MTTIIELRSGLTAEALRNALQYDPETGLFHWLASRKGVPRHKSGPAGTIRLCTGGSRRGICINGHRFYAYRLAFLYMTGDWPEDEIDHINRDSTDDRWVNLRSATSSQNRVNRAPAKTDGLPRGV